MGKCKYTGQVNDQNGPHGQGTAVCEVGYRYEGTFKDGSLAKGKWFNSSGALRYEGEWSRGERYGMGTEFHSDGGVDTGQYERGRLVDGTWTSPDGTTVRKCVNGKWL